MRLVYLYGPPGVGKLTVARELAELTGFKVLHNHLTANLVTSVFPRESEAFSRLIRRFRGEMFAEAARANIDLVVTGVYLGTSEQFTAIRRMIEPIHTGGGDVLFVKLVCDRDTWLARVPSESRRVEGKLTDAEGVVAIFKGGDPFTAMPVGPHLTIDTTHLPPEEAAMRIAAHYALPRLETGRRQVE